MFFKKETILSFLLALVVLTIGAFLKRFKANVADITERDKCPACFGVSLCREIDENKVAFDHSDFYSIFNHLFGVKNVYYGKYGDNKVVMKKLAQDYELRHFDDFICNDDKLSELCFDENRRQRTNIDFHRLILSELANAKIDDPDVKVRLCPTVAKADELLQIGENENFYKYLWYSTKINPEPIILKLLKSKDDWPTPKYYGECGRIIIQEYVGLPLSAFIQEPWIKRAEIASSLLNAAYMFTFKNSKFAFYLTDVSMDNIAINHKNEAIFVDLENVIVVDKEPTEEVQSNIGTWNKIHVSEIHDDCQEDCFVFSPDDICNHKISDHNYFAICQHILGQSTHANLQSQGFLHNPPDKILKQYPTLTDLIKKCSHPDIPHSRITFGIELQKVLNSIVKYKK